MESFHTLHGMTFDATVTWKLKRGGHAIRDAITWTQAVTKEATRHSELTPPLGDTREFEVGALMHMMHDDVSTSEDTLRVGESNFLYPRNNKSVDSIMAASTNAKQLIDFMTSFLAAHAKVTDIFGRVTVPWSVHTMLAPEGVAAIQDAIEECEVKLEANDDESGAAPAKKPLVEAGAFALFDAFHCDQKSKFLQLGQISMLLQHMSLLKVYLCHFDECFELIEEQQVQAFLSGIGKVNGALFHQHRSIDALLLNVALYKAHKSGVKLFCCSDAFTASSLRLEGRLPEQSSFSTMHAVESRSTITPADNHVIKFGGMGDTGIRVAGKLIRRAFILPTERSGRRLPALQLSLGALYGKPVLVCIGAMGGSASTGKKVFLLGDGMQVTFALTAAAIPSNASFQKSLSLVPKGMRDLMDDIRAADLSESGLCIDVIEMRPLLANALGIKEEDLVGRRDKEQQLLNLVKAGASLSAIKATIEEGEAYHIDAVFEQLDKFEKDVYAQGELDQSRKRKYEELDREEAQTVSVFNGGLRGKGAAKGCVYRSLGADAGGGGTDDDMEEEEDEFEEVDADEGAESAPKKPTDIMGELLRACGDKFDGDTFSACKIEMGSMKWAQFHMPDKKGGYVQEPHKRGWNAEGSEAEVIRAALVEFIEKCDMVVQVTRIVYYGMYVHVAPALLKNLLSGGENPTTTHVNMFKTAHEVLQAAA